MELRDLVPSRETCERMKAAGFGDNCVFAWWAFAWAGKTQYDLRNVSQPIPKTGHFAACAPTFAEIAERLPEFSTVRLNDEWQTETMLGDREAAPTAAEAAALLWLALNEKGEGKSDAR